MISKNIIKNEIDKLEKSLKSRNSKIDINKIKDLVNSESEILIKLEELNKKRNEHSKSIGVFLKEKNDKKVVELKKEMELIKKQIDTYDKKINDIKVELDNFLYSIPNMPDESVPIGKDENDNVEVKKWGEIRKFDFNHKPHWELINDLKIGDFERATKVTGSRFFIYKGLGSKLIRSLQMLTLDMHEKKGYVEFSLPVIVNSTSLIGTGQLPKFKEDLFQLANTDYYLSPTLEVQLTNYHRDEILLESDLPLKYTSSSVNFRSEAGSAGKDTRGVIRQHQFYKTEMVNLVHPNKSFEALEEMTRQAESILEILKLPYRRIVLCTGDMGFSSAKTYDIEVWLPSYNAYKEISSCSNCLDFQAKRSMIRFKNKQTGKNDSVHTLNGSGLAIDRLFAAVVENYQNKDGSITIPDALVQYMGTSIIK